MNRAAHARHTGFTLIELLVVVAIIALLISILLPSLTCAREQARAAKCGVQLRSIGTGLAAYGSENSEWIPGTNTSGLALQSPDPLTLDILRNPQMPVQNFDWLTPLLRYDSTDFGENRAQRFKILISRYACPSQAGLNVDYLFPRGLGGILDAPDFVAAGGTSAMSEWTPLSYLMPAHFQYWGQDWNGKVICDGGPRGRGVTAMTADASWETVNQRYRSKAGDLGVAARKIAVADGMRYLTTEREVDFDVTPVPRYFGSFCSAGAWWAGDTTYGVKSGTANWDGVRVTTSATNPQGQGENMVWSYRHGCQVRGSVPAAAQSNKGSINALFFDGHVGRLNDRQSREIEYWYPTGTKVRTPSEGMTRVDADFVIP